MNESEQAQAIEKLRERINRHNSLNEYQRTPLTKSDEDCVALLEIVDSQAQKIAQIEKDFNLAATIAQKHKDNLDAITKEYEDYKYKSGEVVVDLIDKSKEQAKEIERLKSLIRKTGGFEP